jgi:acyl-CoA thioesterase YciA
MKEESTTMADETSPSGRYLAIRSVMMPRDTNALGSVFGGHILSLIDLAAGQHARTIAPKRYVTKVMREVNFVAPVFVGDSVSFYTTTLRVGTTSVAVRVEVEAQRGVDSITTCPVTSAEVVMVAVDHENNPIPVFAGTQG